MSRWNSLNFQDAGSLRIVELIILHDYVLVFITRVLVLILYLITITVISKKTYKNFSERTLIETIWSLVPTTMLIFLITPSIKVLYTIEDFKNPQNTFKVTAHQWYWTITRPLYINLFLRNNKNRLITNYEQESLLEVKNPRLLTRTASLILPALISSRILVTSSDVIHSFSIPSLGLKVDALPGRNNQLYSIPLRIGKYFGQCSEICGSNHSFIPISVQICDKSQYNKISLLNSLSSII